MGTGWSSWVWKSSDSGLTCDNLCSGVDSRGSPLWYQWRNGRGLPIASVVMVRGLPAPMFISGCNGCKKNGRFGSAEDCLLGLLMVVNKFHSNYVIIFTLCFLFMVHFAIQIVCYLENQRHFNTNNQNNSEKNFVLYSNLDFQCSFLKNVLVHLVLTVDTFIFMDNKGAEKQLTTENHGRWG